MSRYRGVISGPVYQEKNAGNCGVAIPGNIYRKDKDGFLRDNNGDALLETIDQIGYTIADNPLIKTYESFPKNEKGEPYIPYDKMISDTISKPKHYNSNAYGIECIDAIKAATHDAKGEEAVFQANVIKYIWRYRRKNGVEDLKKAKWYLDALIELYETGRYSNEISNEQEKNTPTNFPKASEGLAQTSCIDSSRGRVERNSYYKSY